MTEPKKRGRKPSIASDVTRYINVEQFVESRVGQSDAQAYALRVWEGQSMDVPTAERKERVFNALRGQNLSTDGIIFPT